MSLGPGIPDPVPGGAIPRKMHGHKVPSCVAIKKKAILGGLRHEYRLEQAAAYPDEVFAHYNQLESSVARYSKKSDQVALPPDAGFGEDAFDL